MERLSGMDASFLYMETPDMHAHVVGTSILDPSTMVGGGSFYDSIRQTLADRIHLLPPFRRRVVQVPFQLSHPVWIEDPDFDLDAHVHRIALPSPGSQQELAEVVGDIASRPLDRARPLWEMWVVEGLEHDHLAIVTKVHHSAIDGVTGADLMANLFDLSPDVAEVERPDDRHAERRPNDLELTAAALLRMTTQPARLARTMLQAGRSVVNVVGQRRRSDASPAALPFTAPSVPWTGAITPHRSVTFGRAGLDDMKAIKDKFGTTVNDVVLAACTMMLRQWLMAHNALPDRPLVATCPVSVHEEQKDTPGTNKVSSMFVSLPVELEDPIGQLMAIHEGTKGAKEVNRAMGADMITGLAEFAPPALVTRATNLYSRFNLADRHRPIHNLIVSNIPGPNFPFYCAGAQVLATYPMGPILEGCGLNITVLSSQGNVDFGAIACRELVPDLSDMATGFADAVATLKKATTEK